ncbi:hypothetical protein Q6247_26175, partial [Klebsiella pneumoniae]
MVFSQPFFYLVVSSGDSGRQKWEIQFQEVVLGVIGSRQALGMQFWIDWLPALAIEPVPAR